MATRSIKMCDSCGKDGTEKNPVHGLDQKWSDGTRTTGDLCTSCRKKMIDQFNLEHTARRRRTQFKVTPVDEIPRA